MTNLTLNYSFWWIFICLLVGGFYGWVQYTKVPPWSTTINYVLASLRVLLVAFICFILLEPFIQSINNYYQKPLMVIAIDNSESVAINSSEEEMVSLKQSLSEIENGLIDKGYDVNILDLKGTPINEIDSIKFDNSTTDLSQQFNKVKSGYSNFNLAGVVLFSDGIFNGGYSPLAISTNYPIYTVGLGDTSSIKDLAIRDIKHNSTVLEGNSLLLEVLVLNTGYANITSKIAVYRKGRVVSTESIVFNSGQSLYKKMLTIPIEGNGKQSLNISLKPVDEEYTVINNTQTIYFDVIDAQKKILILAAAPHPDLKAIKSSIEVSEYYEVDLAYELPIELDYSLIIAHQYPSVKTSTNDRTGFIESEVPKMMIIGASNDFRFIRNDLPFLRTSNASGKVDFAKPVVNTSFDQFQLEDSFLEWVSDLPPIEMPYGLAVDNLITDDFLHQQIGSVVTEKPLLVFTSFNEQRMGVLLGTNIWKWKLDEYRINQTHDNFNALISKTIQFLSSSPSRKRFYVKPQKEFYEKGEDVLFNTEAYNALFERVIGKRVDLNLSTEEGEKSSYSFVPINENSVYKIPNLPEGVYSYLATTNADESENASEKYYASGQFVIKKLNKEALNPVADFDLLQKLAERSKGRFYELKNIGQFNNQIENLNPVSTIHTTKENEAIINLKLVLIMLILLATAEWFLRKFYGGY